MERIKPLHRVPQKITVWPYGFSDDMKWYYDAHYIRKTGESHGKYIEYYRKFGEQFSPTEKTTEKKERRDKHTGLGEVIDIGSRRKNSIG